MAVWQFRDSLRKVFPHCNEVLHEPTRWLRKETHMKVLIVEPRKRPREAEIDGSLESMQKTVVGYLQAIYPFEDEIALVCDDESKLKSYTEWNRMLPETSDIIKGTFFIAGLGAEDFTDLSPELMEKYKQRFWSIELFIPTPNGLMPILIRD